MLKASADSRGDVAFNEKSVGDDEKSVIDEAFYLDDGGKASVMTLFSLPGNLKSVAHDAFFVIEGADNVSGDAESVDGSAFRADGGANGVARAAFQVPDGADGGNRPVGWASAHRSSFRRDGNLVARLVLP